MIYKQKVPQIEAYQWPWTEKKIPAEIQSFVTDVLSKIGTPQETYHPIPGCWIVKTQVGLFSILTQTDIDRYYDKA